MEELKRVIAKVCTLDPLHSELRASLHRGLALLAHFTPPSLLIRNLIKLQLIPSVDFVPWSKNTRILNQLPKELAAAKAKRLLARPESLLAIHSRYIAPIIYALLTLLYWSRPLALLPPSVCSPFCWVLAYPGQESGALGIWGWLLLLQFTLVPAIPGILRSLSIVPSEKEEQGLASLFQSASKFLGALGK